MTFKTPWRNKSVVDDKTCRFRPFWMARLKVKICNQLSAVALGVEPGGKILSFQCPGAWQQSCLPHPNSNKTESRTLDQPLSSIFLQPRGRLGQEGSEFKVSLICTAKFGFKQTKQTYVEKSMTKVSQHPRGSAQPSVTWDPLELNPRLLLTSSDIRHTRGAHTSRQNTQTHSKSKEEVL